MVQGHKSEIVKWLELNEINDDEGCMFSLNDKQGSKEIPPEQHPYQIILKRKGE